MLSWEIVNHGKDDKVVARVWWDGRRIQCDDPGLLKAMEDHDQYSYNQITFDTGEEFVENLGKVFRGGYLSARPAKEDK